MKHSRTKRLLAVAMCLSLGGILDAQAQCVGGIENPNIESSTPVDQFLESADGTVLHRPTRLVWQRCAGSDLDRTELQWQCHVDGLGRGVAGGR